MNTIIDIKQTELTTTEPVTLAEAKAQCIVTSTDDDALLTALITQCRRAIENFTLTSIINKRIIYTAFLADEWELPYGPVIGIEGVGTPGGQPGSGPVTYDSATGWATSGEQFLNFAPNAGGDNPFIVDRYDNGCNTRYRIQYTTGYNPVPQDLKLAILQEIAYRYEHKGEETGLNSICAAAEVLAMPYKRLSWQ